MREYTGALPFQDLCKQEDLLLVQFGSADCGPCLALRQKLSLWQERHGNVEALYVSTEQHPALAAQEGIFVVPTILFYVDGHCALRESGCFSLEQLLRQVERDLTLIAEACNDLKQEK